MFNIGSDRVVTDVEDVDRREFEPVLPLRRNVAGDEQPEPVVAINDELDDDEESVTMLTSLERVE